MATAQGALKGNCITFLQNTPNIVNSLPLKMADLCDTLKVIFYWSSSFRASSTQMNSYKNIAQLPEDDIPESIMTTIAQILNDKEVPSERAGYILDPLSNSTELNISNVIPINNSAVLDVNGSSISSEKINNCLLNKIKNGGTNDEMNVENVYLIPHSSKPVNEYFNPKLLAGLYPTLFCYGLGAAEDQTRPLTINLREHILFNLLQRRDACFHAQLIATKPYFRSSAQEIHSLNTNDIEAALKNISTGTHNTGSNKALGKLLNHIKTIGGRLMGSAYSRTSLRTHLHAMIFNQSPPNIFLTLNPADIHSPVALYFAGVKLDLDNAQAKQLMDAYKRAEIIASHPVATAKFFHILISNILDTMILGSVVGPVKAYFGTVGSQGRGSLHLHLLIWLNHDLKPADMKNKIQDPSFRENLIAYLEDIIKEDRDEFKDKYVFENLDAPRSFNTPTQLSSDNIYAALRTIDLAGLEENTNENDIRLTPIKDQSSPSIPYASLPNLRGSPSIPYASPQRTELLQTPIHDQSISSMDVSDIQPRLPSACLPTPNRSLPNFWSRFCADVTQLVESGNVHIHSGTCYKYCKAMAKKICRLIMPRKLISVSTIDPETAACRSNMDIKFICTGSDTKALVYYITDYIGVDRAFDSKLFVNKLPTSAFYYKPEHPTEQAYCYFEQIMPSIKRNWCPHPRHLETHPDGRKMFTKSGPKPSHPVGARRISPTISEHINRTCSVIQNNPSLKLNGTHLLCTTCYKQEFRRFQCINEEKLCENLERVNIDDCVKIIYNEVEDSPNLIDVKQDYSIDKLNEVFKMFDLEPVVLRNTGHTREKIDTIYKTLLEWSNCLNITPTQKSTTERSSSLGLSLSEAEDMLYRLRCLVDRSDYDEQILLMQTAPVEWGWTKIEIFFRCTSHQARVVVVQQTTYGDLSKHTDGRGNKPFDSTTSQLIQDFYLDDEISRQSPNAKDTRQAKGVGTVVI
ncbi:unnamed protein product, partial [Adineta steineri]